MNQIKTVYIVRHGQSNDNTLPVFQSYDAKLSNKGLAQAEQLAQRISKLKFDILVSSPQVRARQTADKIAELTGVEAQFSDLFIERFKPTSIDGKPWDDVTANATWRNWERSLVTPNLRIEDGENYDDIVSRADRALEFLEKQSADSLVVVSHGHFIRTIVARILLGQQLSGKTLKQFYNLTSLENTAITVIKFRDAFEEDARWRLWTLNDHAHFAE